MNLNTKKRTCNGCAAGRHLYCELGFNAGGRMCRTIKGRSLFGTPLEKCPKPLTPGELAFAKKWYQKSPRCIQVSKIAEACFPILCGYTKL